MSNYGTLLEQFGLSPRCQAEFGISKSWEVLGETLEQAQGYRDIDMTSWNQLHTRMGVENILFDRDEWRQKLGDLAVQGVYLGTSLWKHPGWLGQLYSPNRYEYRGKVSVSRFERDCLSEYAETFKTVCVDAAYYTFPTERYLGSSLFSVALG